MSIKLKRLLTSAAVASTVVIFADLLVVPVLADNRPACQRGSAWVKEHAGNLPATFDEIASFPMAYRRAIFSTASPEAKAALFRENYRRFAEEHRLSLEQKETVDLASALAIPEVYSPDPNRREVYRAQLEALSTRIRATFPDFNERMVFYRLGPEAPSYTLASWRVTLIEQIRTLMIASAAVFGPELCTCNKEHSGECPSNFTCGDADQQCVPPEPNGDICGPNGTFACDGVCRHT